MESIGKEIRGIIKKKGISLYQVAKDLDVNWESLYRSLMDNANPKWKRIKEILEYLGYEIKVVKSKDKNILPKKNLRRTRSRSER